MLFTKMLKHAKKMTSYIILYHNLVENKSVLLNFIKPKIKYITLIDMGRLTQFDDMTYYQDSNKCDNYSIIKSRICKYSQLHPILNILFIKNYY